MQHFLHITRSRYGKLAYDLTNECDKQEHAQHSPRRPVSPRIESRKQKNIEILQNKKPHTVAVTGQNVYFKNRNLYGYGNDGIYCQSVYETLARETVQKTQSSSLSVPCLCHYKSFVNRSISVEKWFSNRET